MKKKISALFAMFVVILIVGAIFVACRKPLADAEITHFANATIEGKDISIFVEHNVDSVALASSVKVSDYATWALFYDNEGKEEIKDKVAKGVSGALIDGDNVFYIIVTAEDKQHTNTYKLTIYKSFEVTISFYDGETLLTKKSAYTGKQYVIDYEPEIKGHIFNYWYFENAPQTAVTSFTPWEDTVLFANTATNVIKVALDVNGGNNLDETEIDVQYGATFELPVPSYGDNVFLGWYNGEEQVTDEEGRSIGVWTYDSNTTLTAHWSMRYSVTVNSTSGGTITGESGKYAPGEQLTLTAQTLDGYTWLGWYKNGEAFSMDFNLTVEVEESATYTATWIACSVSVNFQVSGIVKNEYEYVTAVDIPSKTVAGEQITLTAPETSQLGYEFIGWYDSSFSATGKLLCDQLEYTFEMPSVATKLYIRYDKKEEMSNYSFNSTDTECVITSISNSSALVGADLVIPDYVTAIKSSNSARGVFQAMGMHSIVVGTGVTEIEKQAFYSCKSLVAVELKGEVTYIGESAFNTCPLLESVRFGNSVQTIDVSAFSKCTLLSEIGNTSGIETLAKEAFYKCTALTSINLPAIKSIGQSAFSGCTALKSAKLGTFSEDGNLQSSNLTELGNSAFAESGLTSIVIPGTVQTVGESAFSKCKSLSDITIEDGVVTLDMYCFQYCPITAIELPNSVETLNYTFYYCDKLESIKFGSGVNFISISTFNGCSSLKEAEFAVTEGWLRRNNTATSGGTQVTEFADKVEAAKLLVRYSSLQKFVRELH